MSQTPLGRPLVVYTAIAYCDTPLEHEVRLITDGFRGYAYGTRYSGTDAPSISRDDSNLIRVDCGQQVDGRECTGQVQFRITDQGWLSVSDAEGAEALDLLEHYGERISQ